MANENKAMTKKQLASMYDISVRTLNVLLSQHEDLVVFVDKKARTYYFTALEVALIKKHLG